MKWVITLGVSLWISGTALSGVLKEEEVLGIAGFQHTGSLSEIVCLSDGIHVLSSSRDDCVRLWEIKSGKLIRRFTKEGSGSMWGMRMLPGDQEFLVATGSNEVIRFELATGKELMTYSHSDDVFRIALHPDGKRFVATDDANLAILWNVATGKEIRKFKGHTGNVYTAIFVEKGKRMVTGSADETFRTWDLETGKCMETSEKIYDDIYTLALSPNGRSFAMASEDKYVRVFNAKTRMEDWKVKLKKEGEVVAWSPDGELVAIAAGDQYLYLFDSKSGKEVRKISVADSAHTPVAFTTDGRTLISGGDQHLHLHDVASGKRISPELGIPFAPEGFELLAVGPKGRRVYASLDEKLYSWNRDDNGKSSMQDEEETIYSLAASPDGALMGVGLESGEVRVRRVPDMGIERKLGTGSEVNALAFSPTGRSLISGGSDGEIVQWATEGGGKIQSFRGHGGKVHDVSVAPGGETFASASEDGSLRIWSLRTKLPLAKLTTSGVKPTTVALINEGRSILASVSDKDGKKRELWGRFLPKLFAKVEISLERINELVLELADEKFEIRNSATDELFAMGEDVLPHLEKVKANDPEVSARLDGVREMIIGKGGKNAIKSVHTFIKTLNMVTGDPSGKYWAGTFGYGKSAKIVLGEVVEEKLVILEELGSDRPPVSVAFSADGRTLVSSNEDGTLTVYSVGK